MVDKDKLKALEQAVQQIDRQFGKGALVRLGDKPQDAIQAISCGSIAVDAALGRRLFVHAAILDRFALTPPIPVMAFGHMPIPERITP